jgi:hypothetical protein
LKGSPATARSGEKLQRPLQENLLSKIQLQPPDFEWVALAFETWVSPRKYVPSGTPRSQERDLGHALNIRPRHFHLLAIFIFLGGPQAWPPLRGHSRNDSASFHDRNVAIGWQIGEPFYQGARRGPANLELVNPGVGADAEHHARVMTGEKAAASQLES